MPVADRPTLFDFAGGAPAFAALAAALHERCLEDPVLNHPFSHDLNPEHLERLAGYLGEVFGGPPSYSSSGSGHAAMLALHAATSADAEMATRFVTCFDQAVDGARLPGDVEFRRVLHEYMVWAVREVDAYAPLGPVVPAHVTFPHWSWDGLAP